MHTNHLEILDFWFQDRAKALWFAVDPSFDTEIRQRFEGYLDAALDRRCEHWRSEPDSCLALIILLDQFPRNMYRNTARAYAYDDAARSVAESAIDDDVHLHVPWERRIFFYLPLQHSEDLAAQIRSTELTRTWAQEGSGERQSWALDHLAWAEHHRQIIERFGRFPHRNLILGRVSSADERAYLAQEPLAGEVPASVAVNKKP